MEQWIVTLGVAAIFLLGAVFGLWLSNWSERTLRQEENKGRILFSMPADKPESAQLLRMFTELAETRIEQAKVGHNAIAQGPATAARSADGDGPAEAEG